MADQLREARRRRILENSEKRLQKILGHPENRDEEPTLKTPPISETKPITVGLALANQQEESQVRKRIHEQEHEIVPLPHVSELVTPVRCNESPTATQQDINEATSHESEKNLYYSSVVISFMAVASISLLTLGYGSLIGNNALVPFLLYTIYKTAFARVPEKQPSGLLNAAVMLSGIPTDTISKISKILGMSSSILQDLCLYLFICLISIQLLQSF